MAVWHSTWPVGGQTVKANRAPGAENTAYIESKMNSIAIGTNPTTLTDHFWNLGDDLSGHHRFMKLPAFTTGTPATTADNPAYGTGIDGVIYLRTCSANEPRKEVFYRRGFGAGDETIYQVSPSVKSGQTSITLTSTFVTLMTLPKNVYGDIYIWLDGTRKIQTGHFISDNAVAAVVEGFSDRLKQVGTSDDYFIELLNGSGAVDLDLKARRGSGASGDYNWIVTWRVL